MSVKTGLVKKNISITESSRAEDSKYNNISHSIDEMKRNFKFNTILVGNSSVGKTSIVTRFIANNYTSDYKCSISVECKVRQIQIDKATVVQLCIWDTCGQEKFRAITKSYYNKAQSVLAVFDITDIISFKHLECWLDDLSKASSNRPVIFIVGNKSDLELERSVSENEIKEYVKSRGLEYIEVSAKTGMNIHLLFEKLANKLVNEKGGIANDEDVSIKISHKESNNKKGCC